MVRHKQPKSLFQISQEWFCQYLGERVLLSSAAGGGHDGAGAAKHQTLSLVRLKLRPFFMEQLPVVVRSGLLEETSEFLVRRSLGSGLHDANHAISSGHLHVPFFYRR